MEGTALVKKRSRTGAAAKNALFPWGIMRCGRVLVKSEVEGGEGKRGSSEDLELLRKEQRQIVAQAYPCGM